MNEPNDEKTFEIYSAGNLDHAVLSQGKNISTNISGSFTSSELSPELTDVLEKIRDLIEQFSQGHQNLTSENMKVAFQVVEKIESDASFKQRSISAFKAGVLEAVKTHPVGSFVIGAIEGWSKP